MRTWYKLHEGEAEKKTMTEKGHFHFLIRNIWHFKTNDVKTLFKLVKKTAQQFTIYKAEACLPGMTWGSVRELYHSRPITIPSRRAGWAFLNVLKSLEDGERACGARQWIARSRGAIVARRAKMASGRITLRKRNKIKSIITTQHFLSMHGAL